MQRRRESSTCQVWRMKWVETFAMSFETFEPKRLVDAGWRAERCNTPLFDDAERAAGVCGTCTSGWAVPGNYPAQWTVPPAVPTEAVPQ